MAFIPPFYVLVRHSWNFLPPGTKLYLLRFVVGGGASGDAERRIPAHKFVLSIGNNDGDGVPGTQK